jgi:hypothetical protein
MAPAVPAALVAPVAPELSVAPVVPVVPLLPIVALLVPVDECALDAPHPSVKAAPASHRTPPSILSFVLRMPHIV